MFNRAKKLSIIVAITACTLSAGGFDADAEKDRIALIEYTEKKFADSFKSRATHFPYSTDDELKNNFPKGIKKDTFALGSYAFNSRGKSQYDDIKEMPPYEDAIDAGEALYSKKFANGKSFKDCFPKADIAGDYPIYDEKKGEVVTISSKINECLTANGEKAWKMKKGNIAKLEAYFSNVSTGAKKKVNVKIESQGAADAYTRGKQEYYAQRGYLKLSCANCHVQGAGQRVRAEYMSPLLGQTTHFPVFRLKWNSLGTLERRMAGCNKDQGENPHKPNSKWMKELLYFMSYMSNGMAVDGPDIRK